MPNLPPVGLVNPTYKLKAPKNLPKFLLNKTKEFKNTVIPNIIENIDIIKLINNVKNLFIP
jgi:hypothetical protein